MPSWSYAKTLKEDRTKLRLLTVHENGYVHLGSHDECIAGNSCHGSGAGPGKLTKHAVNQVDRLLSNAGVEVWSLFAHWVPYVVGPRKRIVVAMDWTDFDPDGQATIMLPLTPE